MLDPYGAFVPHATARLEGAATGPLAGLSFAAKDLFDVAGYVTGGGNPDWLALHAPATRTAPVVQRLVDAGATLVGKTHTDELTRGIFGENAHYGTPRNPKAPGRVSGGSSSGSAAAVAGGLVDFALGTDTGGSVRVPASFCGIYGIRPSLGSLSLEGVIGQARSFDTVGWLAGDAACLARVGAVLLDPEPTTESPWQRLILAEDAFAEAEPETQDALEPALDRLARLFPKVETRPVSSKPLGEWLRHQGAVQGREAWSTFADWIDRHNPRFGFEVADNFLRGRQVEDAAFEAGREFLAARRREVASWLDERTVVALPTTPFPAPPIGLPRSEMWQRRQAVITLTCIAGTLGSPQVSIPAGEIGGLPVGLSILGARGTDGMLLRLACRYAEVS